MSTSVIVVPCYNEATRLHAADFRALVADGCTRVLFVDDGSTDSTRAVLSRACEAEPGFSWVGLEANRGKAAAVYEGLKLALADGAELVGFLDSDGSTPAAELLRVRDAMRAAGVAVAFGSRVRLLGANIDRRTSRHYIGRVFATIASAVTLGVPVYDTQCGAKLFRRTPALEQALSRPFATRWVFDVELLGRLLYGGEGARLAPSEFLEVPLRCWRDVPGSKVRVVDGLRAFADLLRLARAFSKARERLRRTRSAAVAVGGRGSR